MVEVVAVEDNTEVMIREEGLWMKGAEACVGSGRRLKWE